MKQMKKIISLVLAFVMVMSVTASIDFSALAADTDTDNKTVTSASFESSKGNDYLELIEGYSGSVEDSDDGSYMKYYFQYDEGDKITLEFSDGTSDVYTYSSDDGSYSDGSDSLSFYYNSDQSFDNQWTVGDSYSFTVSLSDYDDFNFTVKAHVIENPVKSIKYTPGEKMTFIEGVDGDEYTDDDTGESYIDYNYSGKMFSEGSVLTVNYSDGRTVKYTLGWDENDDFLFIGDDGTKFDYSDEKYFEYYSNQDDEHWVVGGSGYTAVLRYYGREVVLPVTIIANPVESIDYETAEPYEYLENTNGYNSDGNYIYDVVNRQAGDKLTVHYTDGTSSVYSRTKNNWQFENEKGDVISDDDVEIINPQYDEPWGVGTHYFTVKYQGRIAKVKVVIKESNVSSISFTPFESVEIYENTNGYLTAEEDGEGQFYKYNDPISIYDVKNTLTVNYKDGTTKTYVCKYDQENEETLYVCADGDSISPDELDFVETQYTKHWTLGSDNYLTVSYNGKTANVPVTIKENPVLSISYSCAVPITYYENCGGDYYTDDDTGEKYYRYTFNSGDLYTKGSKLTVTYKNGTTAVYSVKGDDEELTDANGDAISDKMCLNYTTNQGNVHWTKGSKNYVTMTFMGAETKIPVNIIESDVKSVKYKKAKPISIPENSCGNFVEVDGYYYYYTDYSESPFRAFEVGDTLEISYKNGTADTYKCVADDSEHYSVKFVNNKNDKLDWSYLTYYETQDEKHWILGSDNCYYVSYQGVVVEVPVTIVENNVKSVDYKPIKPMTYADHTSFYLRSIVNMSSGDIVTVTYTDGTTKDFVAQKTYTDESDGYKSSTIKFAASDGEVLKDYTYELEDKNTSNCTFHFTYYGKTADVPVTCLKETSVTLTKKSPVNIAMGDINSDEDTSERWSVMTDDSNNNYIHYNVGGLYNEDAPRSNILAVGDILTVTYDNGTTVNYTYGGWLYEYGYRLYGDNNEIFYLDSGCIEDNQETDHWTPDGDNYFQIKLGDAVSNKIKVNITAACKEHKYKLVETVPSTCIRHGYDIYNCTVCGARKSEELPLADHSYELNESVASTCGKKGYKSYTCSVCDNTYTEYLPLAAHKYQTSVTKATLSKNGSAVTKCSVCNSVKSETTIYSIKTVSLSSSSYTYNGKAQKPSVTVKDSKGKTVSSKYYSVVYDKGNKSVGKYNVKITFKGDYSGSKTLSYTIKPKNTSISKVTAGKKSFKVNIKKYTTETTGYVVQYSTDKKFKKGVKSVTLKNKTTSATVKKLSAKKKYYVRVCTYKKVGKTTYYSAWSSAKSVTTKK